MKAESIVESLRETASQLGITVRAERGSFRGGRCVVDGAEVIVLNRLHVPEVQLAVLAESLSPEEIDRVFVKPAVRRALEEAWARQQSRREGTEHDEED